MTTTPTLRDAAQRLLKAIEGVRQAEASQGHGRNGFIRTAPTHEHQRRVAEAWRKQANAADHLRAALAEQHELCTYKCEAWPECGCAPRQPAEQAEPAALTDKQVDRMLSTVIPGGSQARDWFMPHESERATANVRGVVRAMYAAAPPAPAAAEQEERVAWRTSAAAWLRQRADQQRKTNAAYPEHVKCYPSWEKRVRDLEWLADDLEREQTSSPPAPALQEWQPPTDSQLEQLFDAAHEHGQFGREFLEHARTILAAQGEQTKE